MADIKTHLRELSVATTIGLLKNKVNFRAYELYDPKQFMHYAEMVIKGDISSAANLKTMGAFTNELRQIVDNGYALGKSIFENQHFDIKENDIIVWKGNETQKEDPIDLLVGEYGFSLKEESFILENMGLYKLLNCYTGSNYKTRHIFKDYALTEYENWFSTTWGEMVTYIKANGGTWTYGHGKKNRKSGISIHNSEVKMDFYDNESLLACAILPENCCLSVFEKQTSSKIREEVFGKFIKINLTHNAKYNQAKRLCAIAAAEALAAELNENLSYEDGLPRFLRIHEITYYYAKTTKAGVEIYKVPSQDAFGRDIVIESIRSSVPDKQANILTTIRNTKTGQSLVLRNECRFSHGQFNGTPEAKMYYEHGGSLEVIYERV